MSLLVVCFDVRSHGFPIREQLSAMLLRAFVLAAIHDSDVVSVNVHLEISSLIPEKYLVLHANLSLIPSPYLPYWKVHPV